MKIYFKSKAQLGLMIDENKEDSLRKLWGVIYFTFPFSLSKETYRLHLPSREKEQEKRRIKEKKTVNATSHVSHVFAFGPSTNFLW